MGYGSFGLPYMTPGAVIANSLDEHQQRKQRLSDMERQTRFDQYSSDIAGIQSNLGKMTPGSPEYIDLAGKLKQAQADRVSLFHPDTQGLDGIRHLIRLIRGKGSAPAAAPSGTPSFATGPGDTGSPMSEQIPAVGGTPAAPGPLTPAQAKQQMADRASGYSLAAVNRTANPFSEKAKLMKESGLFTDEQIQKVGEIEVGLAPKAIPEKPDKYQGQLTTTTDAQGKQHYWRVPLAAGGDPEEVNFNGQKVEPKTTTKPKTAWTKKNGQFFSVQLDANNQIIPGSENSSLLPPSSITGSISTGNYHFIDDKGQIHQVQETHSRVPMSAGGAPAAAPSIPATPKEAKDKATATAPKDKILGHGPLTNPQQKAQTDYQEAVKLSSIADQVAQNPNDAVNQKRLAVALERASAGRFTTQALDYILQAGLGNKIEGFLKGTTTGALPEDIMRQLIDGAHQNLQAADAARRDAGVPIPNSAAPPANQPPKQEGNFFSNYGGKPH